MNESTARYGRGRLTGTRMPSADIGWPLPRHDAQNTACSGLRGRMTTPPTERWRMGTGGDVTFARAVPAADGDGLLALAGSVLQRIDDRGDVAWRQGTLGAAFVHHVGDFDGTGRPCALVRTDPRRLVLVDVATGEICWQWQAAAGTYVNDLGGLKVDQRRAGAVLYLFPTYATEGWCFEFAGRRSDPRVCWHARDLPFDAGFGPSVVLADVDGDGSDELFLSSRTGSDYGRSARDGRTTTAEVVLGREDGVVYQAVMDPASGRIVDAVAFEAVPGAPHRCARPYGLLRVAALAPEELPQAVLASCQVEEYLALTRRTPDGGWTRGDGRFIEKDWPRDERELRPQPSSLADVRGDGRPLLVVGLWQDQHWRTLVLDPRASVSVPVAELSGRYFWGCEDIDGDGLPEILTSIEHTRGPRSIGTLEAWKGGGEFRRIALLRRAAVLPSTNSPLPPDVAFMANRRSAIGVRLSDDRSGVLVRTAGASGGAVALWGAPPGGRPEVHHLIDGPFDQADVAGSAIVVVDPGGRVARVAFDGTTGSHPAQLAGRLAGPLAWTVGGQPEVVVDLAGGRVVGGRPIAGRDDELSEGWDVAGSLPALDVARRRPFLVAADESDRNRPALVIHPAPVRPGHRRRAALSSPIYLGIVPVPGRVRSYVVNLRTGVHTMAIEVRDGRGRLRWSDPGKGAYVRPPAADWVDGAPAVVADDHGELRRYGPDGLAAWMADWTAAYSLPILGPFGPHGEWAILRAGGIHGLELLAANGTTIWRTESALWEFASSTPAVADPSGRGDLALGAVTRSGVFACVEASTGLARWMLDLGTPPNGTSVIAADIDGDGLDEFIVGLPDGRLLCIGEETGGRGSIKWSVTFDAAVGNPIVVDLDADGVAELVVATADGQVRWLA